MTSRVSSKNKGKQVKRKNSVNYRDETEKKRYDKETENSVAGSRTRFICACTESDFWQIFNGNFNRSTTFAAVWVYSK